MNDRQRARFEEVHEVDLAYGVPGLGRFRVNVFSQRGTISLVFRAIPIDVPGLDELNLPPVIKKIAMEERGLVLVTGRHRYREIDHPGGDHRLHQRQPHRPYRHHRGPHRIPAPGQEEHHQPAGGRLRHRGLRRCAEKRPAAGPRRHPGRGDARLRNDRDGPDRRRDGPPGPLHTPHHRRHRNHQPHRLGLPPLPAAPDPAAARVGHQGRSSPSAWCPAPTARDGCRRWRS